MIIIDSSVANRMAEFQRKHGRRMTIEEIKAIANVEEKDDDGKKQKQKLF